MPVKVKKELVDAAVATASAAQGTQRNSVTHKAEWDRFDRQLKSGEFPVSLAPMVKKRKDKVGLFNVWLDSDMNWDRTEFQVERFQSKESLSRSQWTAIQAKDLKEKLGQEKFDLLFQKRLETGLTYPNEDFPGDPMETYGCICLRAKRPDRTRRRASLLRWLRRPSVTRLCRRR